MHADLMRAPRVQMRPQEIARVEARESMEIGARLTAIAPDRDAGPIVGVAPERLIDAHLVGVEMPPAERRVAPRDRPRRERPTQRRVCAIGLGDDQEPRGLLVEAMHEPHALRPAPRRQRLSASEERIHQRPRPVPGRGMHHHPRRLVDDHQILVLIDDADRDRFGKDLTPHRRGDRDGERHPRLEPETRLLGAAIDLHLPGGDECRSLRARSPGEARDGEVESLATVIDREGVGAGHQRIARARRVARHVLVGLSVDGTAFASVTRSSPSFQSTIAKRIAPVLTAMSARLKVGQRQAPTPTSRKSTTPRGEMIRSMKLPNAPPVTEQSARTRQTASGGLARQSRHIVTTATTVRTMKIQREYDPRCSPKAAPGLYTSVRRNHSPRTSCGTQAGESASTAIRLVI